MTSPDIATGTTVRRSTVEQLADRLPDRPVLLAVWAHPDDESYLGAGLMAEIARRHGRVINVTATAGEHGTDDPDRWPPAALAAHRLGELDRALGALGAGTLEVLGFADGACDRVPTEIGASRVREMVEHHRPDVVLSFGDDGVTGHPDHRAVATWTRRAAGATPLLCTAAGAAWPQHCVDRMRSVGAFWPGFPKRQPIAGSIRVDLGGELLVRKLAALRCHAHQVEPIESLLGADRFRELAASEAYRPVNRAGRRLLRSRSVGTAA